MKKFLKNWVIPPGYIDFLNNTIKTEKKEINPENLKYRNIHSDLSRCFILATGPSINNIDLLKLKDELCIGTSLFHLHNDYKYINPEYHCFAPSHPPITDDQLFEGFKQYKSNKTEKTKTIIADYDYQKYMKKGFISDRNYIKYNKDGVFPVDFTKKVPSIRTVVHLAIYWAIYTGIKEIYLLGVDHNFLENFKNTNNMHFYKENDNKMTKKGFNVWDDVDNDLGNYCYLMYLLWEEYKNIKKYTEKSGFQIFNATPGSFLDVFPKKNLNEILN